MNQPNWKAARAGLVTVAVALLVASNAPRAAAQDFALTWNLLPAGGDVRTYADGWVLSGAFSDVSAYSLLTNVSHGFALQPGGWAILNHVSPACEGDFNGDFVVDLSDVIILLVNFGQSGVPPWEGDLDGDGTVSLSDLTGLLVNYGNSCE